MGILKQYKAVTSPPFTQDYEVQPRSEADIFPHPGPIVVQPPHEDSIRADEVRIRWLTDVPSTSVALYGTTLAYSDSVTDPSLTTDHVMWLTDLTPATTYHYAIASADSSGRTNVAGFLFSSASPAATTGEVNAYFNKDVNTSVAAGEAAPGNQDLVSLLVRRLDAARHSIDACFYNLSGSPGAAVADALVRAKERGIKVRLIGEADNDRNAPFATVSSNGIPFITDEFDPSTGGAGLMHDKFVVIDGRGGAPESVWVWTGSWNPTAPGTNDDRQNSIEIQDQALANVYVHEFDEMWGSPTQQPNAAASRFGSRKIDDTPHRFNVGGREVECYFSPSDHTTSAIGRALSRATRSVCESMYTFTRRDLADSLIAQRNRGRKVRVVLDNNTDSGNQYATLVIGGVDVHLKGFDNGYLHHKYAVVDATDPAARQWVVTGSHNWSSAAENSNNENTLVIQDNRIANFYLQEFYARYLEAGGSDPIVLDAKEPPGDSPRTFALAQNHPNPFNPVTVISYTIARASFVSLKVFDVLGREVVTLVNERQGSGAYTIAFNAAGVSSGVYFYRLVAGDYTATKKLIVAK